MDKVSKNQFSNLKKDTFFYNIIKKITLGDKLADQEIEYSFVLSIIFLNEYKKSDINSFFEFSYYLVLRLSLMIKDYKSLLEFSINNGFYPIAKAIYSDDMYKNTIDDYCIESSMDYYKENNIIRLKEQKEKTEKLINSNKQYRAYIAPTSYGKSSFIRNDIISRNNQKIGIIVPKKALIWQNYQDVKELAKKMHYRVLLFDSEYNDDNRVLCIFTQERALRLIQDSDFSFDILYIDEAHNIFLKDERNIVLSRLIKLNKKKNTNHQVIYLSPLIKDVNNLRLDKNDDIDLQKIQFNIKDFDISYYDGTAFKYNKYINEYFNSSKNYTNWIDYINKESHKKNLIYFYRPKDIEKFAKNILINEPDLNNDELDNISKIVAKYTDNDYLVVKLIKKGYVYVHGKIPDLIKEYLLDKFKTVVGIKYLISNNTVLEGVNFPIDCLFILNVYNLKSNDLINLCGRVNRLNEIFGNPSHLERLICPIHFVKNDLFSNDQSFKNKIELLRMDISDDVLNPTLINTKSNDDKSKRIAELENNFINDYKNKQIKNILVKNSINSFYKDYSIIQNKLINRIVNKKPLKDGNLLIDYIYELFIKDFEYKDFSDNELSRLLNSSARKFYCRYLDGIYYKDIKTKIHFFLEYFKYYEEHNMQFYIGESFGEIEFRSDIYTGDRKTYIDPAGKDRSELLNLAIIKSKIEDDFIGFKVQKIVKTLFDLNLINDEISNKFLFNSANEDEISLLKAGVSFQMINFIKDNDLMKDVSIDDNGINVSQRFKKILSEQDDYLQFEIKKLI